MKPKKEQVGQRISYIKELLGLSLAKFAELLGISKGTFNSYVKGIVVPPENIVLKISEISKYPKDWIYYGELNEYISEALITGGYEEFIDDYPYIIGELSKEFTVIESGKYPHPVEILAIFKKKYFQPKFDVYVSNLILPYTQKIKNYPINDGGQILGEEKYIKNVWMSLGVDCVYGNEEKILAVAQDEFERWINLHQHFNKNAEDNYKRALELLIEHLSDDQKADEMIKNILLNMMGIKMSSEDLVEIFKELIPKIEKLKNDVKG